MIPNCLSARWRQPSVTLATALSVLLVSGLASAEPAGYCKAEPRAAQPRCLDGSAPRVRFSGEQTQKTRPKQSDPGARLFDARGATWSGIDAAGNYVRWPVTLRGNYSNGCWSGGTIKGAWNDTDSGVSWVDPYHSAGAMSIEVAQFTVENLRIEGHGDGIVTDAPGARLRGVYMTDIHDDCVQNDYMHSVSIKDSFLDGCYVAFSARAWKSGIQRRPDNLWEIHDSLVRLEPQPVVYAPHRLPSPGHGPFFKWAESSGQAPRVSIRNTVFRADQDANHDHLGLPSELELADCSNNTMVWLGKGPFPDADKLPDCFTITTDVSVWDEAAARWHASR